MEVQDSRSSRTGSVMIALIAEFHFVPWARLEERSRDGGAGEGLNGGKEGGRETENRLQRQRKTQRLIYESEVLDGHLQSLKNGLKGSGQHKLNALAAFLHCICIICKQ